MKHKIAGTYVITGASKGIGRAFALALAPKAQTLILLARHAKALKAVARTEGLLVGPVYPARAFCAMLDQIRHGQFNAGETWLFWHTGDETALHAYADDLIGANG